MQKQMQDLLDSSEFKAVVAKRWRVSVILTLLLFVIYYGFILLVGLDKPFLAQKIGEVTTLGIPLAVLVIVGAWVLTAIYIVWSNSAYDPEIERLRARLKP